MKIRSGRFSQAAFAGAAASALLLLAHMAVGEERSALAPARVTALMPASAPYIDAHIHIDQNRPAESMQLLL